MTKQKDETSPTVSRNLCYLRGECPARTSRSLCYISGNDCNHKEYTLCEDYLSFVRPRGDELFRKVVKTIERSVEE